ncbi:MAG: TetR/AcrR family transcriptional regulator [Bdellovibrionales bacterium]|nr:TetR/AcrR family transcriptional regulator [Ramlibacter sp.]
MEKAATTRKRLVDAATELFIQKGFRGVSIREIAERADTNSALISYYFGDKEGLFKQVFKDVAMPLNLARMFNFEQLEASGNVTLETVVRAWVAPTFEGVSLRRESPVATLSLSLNAEHVKLAEQIIVEVYDEVNLRFLGLLEQCLPGISRPTLVWRLYFLVGAVLTATRPRAKSVKNLSGSKLNPRDPEELVDQLVAFAVAGFRAMEPDKPAPAPRARTRPIKPKPQTRRRSTTDTQQTHHEASP